MADELDSLLAVMAERRPSLIGVDGMNGVGKSRRVAKRLGLPVLSLDDFLIGNGSFIDGIEYDRLLKAVRQLDRPGVVEGCCLLAALGRVGQSLDLHVYARRVSEAGYWYDADVGEGEDLEQVLKREREIAKWAKAPRKGLAFELIHYHAEFKPLQNAGLILDLVERPAD
jgi:hypothetical protein